MLVASRGSSSHGETLSGRTTAEGSSHWTCEQLKHGLRSWKDAFKIGNATYISGGKCKVKMESCP